MPPRCANTRGLDTQEQYLRMRTHGTTRARVFSGFSAALLRDRRISWPAVDVLTYLWTLPTGARLGIRNGRDRTAAALRELEELRYLRRVVREDAGSGGLAVTYEVFDSPCEAEPLMGEFEEVEEVEEVADRPAPSRHTVRAAHLLISLRNIDPRLTLDGPEAMRLAPLVEKWWERGVSTTRVRAALAYDWPGPVHSAAAHVEALLRDGCPVAPTAAPVTVVEVELRRSGAWSWRAAVRRGGELVRALMKRRAMPA